MYDFVLEDVFKNKRYDKKRLTAFGFSLVNGKYQYSTDILNGQFLLTIQVDKSSKIETELIEKAFGEKFTLHLIYDAKGSFVGSIKKEYSHILKNIADKCFEPDFFKSTQSRNVIEYIRKKYGDEPQYLWDKFPSNAVFRRKDNDKWYGILLVVKKSKIGFESDELIDILDLRADEKLIDSLVDGKKYFRGYHMNKRHWITLCMDGSLPIAEIRRRIDDSYKIAKK